MRTRIITSLNYGNQRDRSLAQLTRTMVSAATALDLPLAVQVSSGSRCGCRANQSEWFSAKSASCHSADDDEELAILGKGEGPENNSSPLNWQARLFSLKLAVSQSCSAYQAIFQSCDRRA